MDRRKNQHLKSAYSILAQGNEATEENGDKVAKEEANIERDWPTAIGALVTLQIDDSNALCWGGGGVCP